MKTSGIIPRYKDGLGQWRTITPKTRQAIRAAIGSESAPAMGLKVLPLGQRFLLKSPVELRLEDGTLLHCEKTLPPDLPMGYHQMSSKRETTRLIIALPACYLPESLQGWGWAAQLPGVRSRESWGMGDFQDLRALAQWASRQAECKFILVNPLGANLPITPQQASPYYPSSRRFLNPLYIRLDASSKAGRALNKNRLIDRDAVFDLKMAALEKLWRRFSSDVDFEHFRQTSGRSLTEFATFCALAEHFKSGWKKWPENFRKPDSSAVKEFAHENQSRILFHEWLQWLAQDQLKQCSQQLPIVQDLPIGFDPDGADAWAWQDLLAPRMSVGAPPDAYNVRGQNWGLPPFIPGRLRAAGYEPFRETLRAMMRPNGGLRIDHVMGLFRLFWIPDGISPEHGAFVHYPWEELLAVLAIESHRAGSWVVGEDLGTVEPWVRTELKRRNILSYRLLWFENKPVEKFPREALSAVTTHDLYTTAGLWTGADFAAQKKIGLNPDEADRKKILQRLHRKLNLTHAKPAEAVAKTYQLLAKSPSRLLTATLEDALAVEDRPNMPGTTTEWPNWSLALPVALETLQRSKLAKEIARSCARKKMTRANTGNPKPMSARDRFGAKSVKPKS